ncbi:MAG TPA: hypothetical protein VK638_04565 [Edaphobacter sp.]|nr:hypothetical protein [Edaphobacter sp.]
MANVIECPVWVGTGADDAGGWPCSDCEGRGMNIINNETFSDDEQDEDAFVA